MVSQVGAPTEEQTGFRTFGADSMCNIFICRRITLRLGRTRCDSFSAKLAGGKPVFDGYLVKNNDNVERMSRCDEVPANDPRLSLKNVGVPVIRIAPQGAALRPVAWRADSDAPNDRFRHYEVAGTPHMDKIYFDYLPSSKIRSRWGSRYLWRSGQRQRGSAPPILTCWTIRSSAT